MVLARLELGSSSEPTALSGASGAARRCTRQAVAESSSSPSEHPWLKLAMRGSAAPGVPSSSTWIWPRAVAISGNQSQSVTIRVNQWQSEAIRGNQRQSEAINDTHLDLAERRQFGRCGREAVGIVDCAVGRTRSALVGRADCGEGARGASNARDDS